MAIIIIFLFVNLFMWASVAFAYSLKSIQNEPYLIGIRIPREYQKTAQVQNVLAGYKVRYRKITWIGFLTALLMLLANEYMSILILLIVLWFFGLMWFYQKNVMDSARSMYEVKQKNGWLMGETHVVRIDTALSCLRDKNSVSIAWWILSGGAAAFTGFLGWQELQPYSMIYLLSFGSAFILLFLVYLGIRYAKPQVYCEESEINQKINGILKFEWTRCFVIQGYFLTFLSLYLAFPGNLVKQVPEGVFNATSFAAVSCLLAAGTFLIINMAYFNVRKVKKSMFSYLADKGKEIYGDDDEYWLNGYKGGGKRPTGLTEKRIGIGFTFSSASGYLEKGIIAITILFTLGISLFVMSFDFAQVELEIQGDKCRIQAASMGASFDLKEVERITLLDELPSMKKKSGYDSNNLQLGDFRVEGYGICKVYVSFRNESVILIETEDGIIWLNSESEAKTQEFYRQLTEKLNHE